ncbi:hypothetical protein CYLTODRAFT_447065 [Cylindrobasidium torrendii FP15055 ss-10]|uniref:MYND-type domain-containing protein n=1 Tax=Cylindrobasidium torrendii FP15055 ss-10 TaxID=1314674 RepID=A0A0D7AWP8_9AGAR|nr:hypothetical protein CYLTODRAFT_447065 [Cylindrobasidium torrendii FP15055 ss-10]
MSPYTTKSIPVRGCKDSKMPSRVNINGNMVSIPHPSTISAFVDSLADPEIPTRCSLFYAGVEDVFCAYPECAEELRRMHPQIFAAAIRFLSYPRSKEDVANIAQPECRCPEDANWWVHDVPRNRPSTTSGAGAQLFDSICSIASRGLVDTKEVGFTIPWPTIEKLVKQSEKSLKATGHATWPSKYADVFGTNPRFLVQMLWSIFEQFPDAYHPLFLLYSLVKLNQSPAMAALARVPGWARQLLNHTTSTLDAGFEVRRYLGKFDLLTEFMNETRVILGRGGDGMDVFRAWHQHDDYYAKNDVVLFASRALCMDIFEGCVDIQTEKLAAIGTFFYGLCECPTSVFGVNLLGDKWPKLSPRIKTESANQFSRYQSDRSLLKTDACHRIHDIAVFNECAAPNCLKSTATLNRKLQACSGCHIVRYCSQKCQRDAWKHSDIPHKPMCRLFSTVTKNLGVDWKKFTTPEQQAILKKNIVCLTEKEAQEVIDLEMKMSTWRTLASMNPTKEVTVDFFRAFMKGMLNVQEMQRAEVDK